jgi:hypothetical protein
MEANLTKNPDSAQNPQKSRLAFRANQGREVWIGESLYPSGGDFAQGVRGVEFKLQQIM